MGSAVAALMAALMVVMSAPAMANDLFDHDLFDNDHRHRFDNDRRDLFDHHHDLLDQK